MNFDRLIRVMRPDARINPEEHPAILASLRAQPDFKGSVPADFAAKTKPPPRKAEDGGADPEAKPKKKKKKKKKARGDGQQPPDQLLLGLSRPLLPSQSKAAMERKLAEKQALQTKFRYILSLPELPKGKAAVDILTSKTL